MTTRTPLRRDLADLKQKVYLLGEKCIEISNLYNSLVENYSATLENRIKEISNEVKRESKELNEQCFLVLTLQQPLIRDLRLVIGSLQIVINLEKISEQYSSTISLLTEISLLKNSINENLIKMSYYVKEILNLTLTFYLSSNVSLSEEILKKFSEVSYLHDILYKQILQELAQESGQKAQIEAQLLATVRSLEKISDLTLSIAEQVKFIIAGKSESQI